MNESATPITHLTLTRVFDAPREKVFKAWIDSAQVKEWWGPKTFTNPVCEIDARVDGALNVHMQAPDGEIFPMGGMFKEIDEPSKLVFTSTALGKDGKVMLENLNAVTFEDEAGKTKLVLNVEVLMQTPEMAKALEGMEEGWSGSFDKLAAFLA